MGWGKVSRQPITFPGALDPNLVLPFLVLKPFEKCYTSVFVYQEISVPTGLPWGEVGQVCVLLESLEEVFGEAFKSSMDSVRFTALAQRVDCGYSFAPSVPLIFPISKTEIIELTCLPVP